MSSKIDKSKISRLSDILKRDFDDGLIPGASVILIKDGEEVFYDDVGYADIEEGKKISRDTYFRMYSQTKPYTGLAAAMCVERGIFSPREPVYNYFPTFANKQYEVDGSGVFKPTPRPVLISDLLNMTSGISYPSEWDEASRQAGKLVEDARKAQNEGIPFTTREFVSRLGEMPLAFAPGDRWAYGYSADVTGGVIGEANGCTFGEFMKKEILEPLGMTHTGFDMPNSERHKLAKAYRLYPEGLRPEGEFADRHLGLNAYKEGEVFFESGGAGFVSTIDDLAQFSKFMINRGKLGDTRLISEAGFNWYTSPQLTPHQARTFNWQDFPEHNYGNFITTKMMKGCYSTPDNVGTFGWGGWLGTNCFVDPVENMSMVFLVQRLFAGDPKVKVTELYYRLRSAAYSALV